MNLRTVDIAQKLSAWLDRYAPPLHMRNNPKATQSEAEALARILCKHAPADDYQPFLNQVFGVLDETLKHRVWPTAAEIGAACVNVKKSGGSESKPEIDARTPAQKAAARMTQGLPVGEGYLYGICAVEIIAEGLIDEATMRQYRSGAFFARKDLYGEAAALAWEAKAKQRHEDAKACWRNRDGKRGFGGAVPNKRAYEEQQA